jgi:hypothetical protein
MGIPLVLMTRLFQLVSQRKFAEAERVLKRIKSRINKRGQLGYNRGYLEALNGIILTSRSTGERYEFFGNLDINDIKELKKHHKDFLDQTKNRFHTDYDRGYFSALADYMRVIIRTRKNNQETISNKG